MDFAEQARQILIPLINQVLAGLSGPADAGLSGPTLTSDPALRAFFTGMLLQARAMREEEDVLTLFFELSTTAFHGFVYGPEVAAAIDELLAAAERMAYTMTASDQLRH